jgi:hypothetical protein
MNSAAAKIHFIAPLSPPLVHLHARSNFFDDSADTGPLACAQISAKLRKIPGSLDQV